MPPSVPASDAFWTAHIEPLLKAHCADCHNATKTKSGLDVTSFQTLLRGGERGASLIPGRPDDSNLYKFLSAEADPHMPPGNRKALTPEEVGLIKKWIEDMPKATPSTQDTAVAHAPLPENSTPGKAPIRWQPNPGQSPARVVDTFLELSWQRDQIEPAKRLGDAQFARRLYLDLVGRIPTTEEVSTFRENKSKNKPAELVELLLASSEYARHMREVFDAVLMTRRGASWEEKRANQKWFTFLESAFQENRPWDKVVRDLIVARPERAEDKGAIWYLYERQNNAQAVAEAVAPVVFGVQIKCAQCHDHMVAREIKQAHYWGTVAAFNRSKNVDTPNGPGVAESAIGGFASFANLKKESQPALLTFFNGRRVDEKQPTDKEVDTPDLYAVPPPRGKDKPQQPYVPKFSRREAFADAVTQDNPLLARAMVNRIWALLFGRGIVHPVDLMDSKHPPSHPELLDWLTKDFERSGYDVKRLVAYLTRTRAYQLDSRQPASAKGTTTAPLESFSRGIDKPLTAEQLYRSLLVATGHKPDAEGKIAGRSEDALRHAFVAQFPDLFVPEYNATLYQAMFFSNASLFDQLLASPQNNLVVRLEKLPTHEARVREAFETVYARVPDPQELKECTGYLARREASAGIRQLIWAMLTSAEFQLNH